MASSAEKAQTKALEAQTEALKVQASQLTLDSERADRKLAADIAIANAAQALQQRILEEYQMGTLTEAKRAALVDEALKTASFEFSKNMSMRQYGLDQAATTGYFEGSPTLKRTQMEIDTVMNAPRGPADYAAYTNRLRGLNKAGDLPGILNQLFTGNQVAAYSDGGQVTPNVATNTDLALAMVGASRNQNAATGVPHQPPTNFLLPQGPAVPNGQGGYQYQEFMVDPNRPELGYRQPSWAGQPLYADRQPYTTPTAPAPGAPASPGSPAGHEPQHAQMPAPPPAPPPAPAPAPPPAPAPTPAPAPSVPPGLPAIPGGNWESSGYTGSGEWSPYLFRNQGFSGYYEPRKADDEHYDPWWEQVGNAGPEPTVGPPTWDQLNGIRRGSASAAGGGIQDQPAMFQEAAPPPVAADIPHGYSYINAYHPEYGYQPGPPSPAPSQPSYQDSHTAVVPPGHENGVFGDTPSNSASSSAYDIGAVQNMFAGVFGTGSPTVPMGKDVSLQQFRNLTPTEQALATGYASEFGPQTPEDFLDQMEDAAPTFQQSPKARLYGIS